MFMLIRQIMRFCGPYASRIRAAWVLSFLKSLFSNAPIFMAVVLVNLLLEGALDVAGCIVSAVVLMVLIVLQSVCQNAVDRLQSAAGYEIFADARMNLATHLRALPMGYFTEGNIGKISSILSNDMVYIEEQSMRIIADVASDVFSQLIIVAFLFWMSPLVGCVGLATVVLAVIIAQPMNREALSDSARRQQTIEDLTDAVIEYTQGMAVNKSFNRAGAGASELRSAFTQMTDSNLTFEYNHAPWERRLLIVYALGMTAVVALSIWLLGEGSLAIGSFIGVMLFAFNLFAPIKHLYMQDVQVTIMKSCLDRLQEVLDEPRIADSGMATLPQPVASVPEVEFDNVTFGYGDEPVLKNVSFVVETGQTVALVGQSGSGKTTIANLLARFWDIDEGTIRVRGIDVRTLSLEQLMDALSMVFQHVYLFEDTVYNNIAMGNAKATPELVRAAARKAHCHEFIESLPYGYETVIGEGGASLSGGEAQRLSIARCILKDAPIVILDEATANLDADNESAIQQAMSELCRDKTTLVIAHRLNTIASADAIVVLEEGSVVEAGSPSDLLAADGVYARMVAAAQKAGEWSDDAKESEL